MKRRTFLLRSLAAAAGAVAVPTIEIAQVRGPGQKAIIVGAGLSGLVAAYELDKRGYDVRVLEAQSHVGGRVLTLREFSEGLHAEAGAARIPADHDLTHKYVKEFNLPLAPFYPTDGKFLRVRGQQVEEVGWDKFKDATSIVMALGESGRWQKIRGGNDQLPKAFADKLAGKINYNSPVAGIRHDLNNITVVFKGRSGIENISGDLLVCAIPFTMLRRIEFSPALRSDKMDAIRNMDYDTASRVFIETRRRFWIDKGQNGFAFGEDAAEIWNSTFGQSGTHGIMQSYLRGGYSWALTRLSESDRTAATVEKLTKLFPETGQNLIKGVSKCWSEDPWVEGAWASPDRNAVTIGKRAEGRIFFAGEHLSSHGSWMQGALESGLDVVQQILSMPAKANGAAQ